MMCNPKTENSDLPDGLADKALDTQAGLVLKHGPGMSMTTGSVTTSLSPGDAVSKLMSYGVNKISFTPVSSRKKQSDYDSLKNGQGKTDGTSCTPFKFGLKAPSTLAVSVPKDYNVYKHDEKQYKFSNAQDIKVLRSAIWHEIMESAFLYISYFEGGDPYNLTARMVSFKLAHTPVHDEVLKKQKEFLDTKFYGWNITPSDPLMYFWEVNSESSSMIVVRYGCWPRGFAATVYDQSGKKSAELLGLAMKPGGFTLDSKNGWKAGLYFVKLNDTSISSSVKKAVIYK